MLLRKELQALALPVTETTSNSITLTSNTPTSTSAATTLGSKISSASSLTGSDSLKFVKTFFTSTKTPKTSSEDEVTIRRDENKEKLFMRPGVIEEEPDSMDSIISDPTSFPITIVPSSTGGTGILIRNSTAQSSFSRLSRISTTSK